VTPKTSTSPEKGADAAQAPSSRGARQEPGRHAFMASPNPRHLNCVRCGKPANAHLSTELQRATAIAHFKRAVQRIREGDTPSARLEAEAALRILEER
jgi:hypothetical protein